MTLKQFQKQKAATNRFSHDLYNAKYDKGFTLKTIGDSVGLCSNQVKVLMDNPDKMTLKHLRDFCNLLEVVPTANFIQAYGFMEEKA